MVHAEVYEDPEGSLKRTAETGQADFGPTTAAVNAYKLNYEPGLFLAGRDGLVRTRLDSLFDQTEVASALSSLS